LQQFALLSPNNKELGADLNNYFIFHSLFFTLLPLSGKSELVPVLVPVPCNLRGTGGQLFVTDPENCRLAKVCMAGSFVNFGSSMAQHNKTNLTKIFSGVFWANLKQRTFFMCMSGNPLQIESVRLARNTEYLGFRLNDPIYDFGVTHHSTGLGKLKVFSKENGTEYGVPVEDLMKPMSQWRIDKR
jgi:hypothetical protein